MKNVLIFAAVGEAATGLALAGGRHPDRAPHS
jgi:hypothetical protein